MRGRARVWIIIRVGRERSYMYVVSKGNSLSNSFGQRLKGRRWLDD